MARRQLKKGLHMFLALKREYTDAALVPIFKYLSLEDRLETLKAGRKIFVDVEMCEVHIPGSRNFGCYPALSISHYIRDPVSGDQTPVTYAERFSEQYRQFKASQQQTKRGTPLSESGFLTPAKCAELRAQNIYTVEALAQIDGQELKNLGPGGRDLKNQATEFITSSAKFAPDMQLAAELEATKAKLQALEDDNIALKGKIATGEAQFEQMGNEGLRDYIAANSGVAPQGHVPKKVLIRMAMECRQKQLQKAD